MHSLELAELGDCGLPRRAALDKLLRVAGEDGAYQRRLLALFCVVCALLGVLWNAFPVVFALPAAFMPVPTVFFEHPADGKIYLQRLQGSQKITRSSVFTTEDAMFGNVETDYYRCITLVLLFNFFFVVPLLISTKLMGQRGIHLAGLLLCTCGAVIGLKTWNSYTTAIVFSLMLFGGEILLSSTLMHLNESTGGTLRSRMAAIGFMVFAASGLLLHMLSSFIEGYKHVYYIILVLALGLQAVCVPLAFDESPGHYLRNGQTRRLVQALRNISKINHSATEHSTAVVEISALAAGDLQLCPKKSVFSREYFGKVFGVMLINGNLAFVYTLLHATSQLDNGTWWPVSMNVSLGIEVTTFALMAIIAPHCNRKAMNIIAAGLFIAISAGFFFVPFIPRNVRRTPGEGFLFLALKFVACANYGTSFSYLTELLPGELYGKTVVLSLVWSKLLCLGSMIAMFKLDQNSVNPLLALCCTSFFALVAAACLPETRTSIRK